MLGMRILRLVSSSRGTLVGGIIGEQGGLRAAGIVCRFFIRGFGPVLAVFICSLPAGHHRTHSHPITVPQLPTIEPGNTRPVLNIVEYCHS